MSQNTGSIGTPFWNVLTLIFVVLKLTGVIDWSWWWVFSPSITAFIIFFIFFLGYAIAKGNLK